MVSSDGVDDVLSYVEGYWTYIGLYDHNDEITRFHAPSDDRVTWTIDTTANEVVATITVRGSDNDIVPSDATEPTTITETKTFLNESTTNSLSTDTDTEASVEADNDEAIITHTISLS